MTPKEIKIVIKELEKILKWAYNYSEPIDSWGHDDIFVPDIIDAKDIRERIRELKQK